MGCQLVASNARMFVGSMPMENKEEDYVHLVSVDVDISETTQDSQPFPMKQEGAYSVHAFP